MRAKNIGLAALALPLLLLGACGGGNGGNTQPEPPMASNGVPVSATATARAYSHFVSSLGGQDNAEPLDLGSVVAPTSETDEPVDA